ncbi:PfaD family polyunsaturated fatty acid/polyketide biosynthesis protein [Geobacter sp. AOG1]|uniref:PfaD family polyunsaturated fatty acid/polyketide biosynthesis protein n=1 Tax=Geobacter sp. AOG1 TaxID=1566346 RepID=UPI001CC74C6A|nr:PfaD family polyunsaturated fatty acid/polyketide biosynthesis protein [Geobacter sp. AOG1]GFE58714.1 2-nitropropane dioxygenase [Geobacter sp. AOG1]
MDQFQQRGTSASQSTGHIGLGWWRPASPLSLLPTEDSETALRKVRLPVYLVAGERTVVMQTSGTAGFDGEQPGSLPLLGYAPPCLPENLGDTGFCADLGIRYPYLGGSMAKGISSAAMVEELGRAGMLGFFGAAGLPYLDVEKAVDRLAKSGVPYGVNLIHSPHEPDLEQALADLYLQRGVQLLEASAFLSLTLPLVRYSLHGIHRRDDGTIVTPNRIIAKISREEMAAKFFSPAPESFLRELVAGGELTSEQAELAAQVPLAREITAEADSGGHTDNRPAIALFPTIQSLAARLERQHGYDCRLRVGLAGGISTPAAAAAAFAMGAAYIMTGSVHQACIESGTSRQVREMLAGTRQADVAMAPAADMFEMGVTVQVLKRGTMFPMRAAKLYELYRSYGCMEDIPAPEREKLEKTLFLAPLTDIWRDTRAYFQQRDPRQAERGDRDPKHRMALVFRWYLGQAAHWAKDGEPSRKIDYQVWCGPAMGAFNEWVAGTYLESPERRATVSVALNILYGAAVFTRINFLRSQGIQLPPEALRTEPLELEQIKEYLR